MTKDELITDLPNLITDFRVGGTEVVVVRDGDAYYVADGAFNHGAAHQVVAQAYLSHVCRDEHDEVAADLAAQLA